MSYIVKSLNKKTGVMYAYSAESYYIPGVGSRSHRKCIGKIDPDSGAIVPTGKRGPRPKQKKPDEAIAKQETGTTGSSELKAALIESTQKVNALESTVQKQKEKIAQLEMQIIRMQKAFSTIQGAVENALQ